MEKRLAGTSEDSARSIAFGQRRSQKLRPRPRASPPSGGLTARERRDLGCHERTVECATGGGDGAERRVGGGAQARLRGNARSRGSRTQKSPARDSVGDAARAGQVPAIGLKTPAGPDSRPPGVGGIRLGRVRRLLQLELTDDDAGGAAVVAFVPPKPIPNPPAVLTLIIEQRPASGADVVIKFRHDSASCSRLRRREAL